jgi:hypothetical protein
MAETHTSDPEALQNDGGEVQPEDLTPEQLAEIFGHCAQPGIIKFPFEIKEIAEEGKLEYPPRERQYEKTSDGEEIMPFEYAEHCWLGDSLHLQGHDTGSDKTARMNPFKLENGLLVTYGQINGLAGDFFGTSKPICEGDSPAEQKKRFRAAYDALAKGYFNEQKALKILDALRGESEAVTDAYRKGIQPVSEVYQGLADKTVTFQVITSLIGSGLSYLRLAKINLDHFGTNARKAYNAGHAAAIEEAGHGNLELAYTMNAFADHFLEDSFASGHFRVPRPKLFDSIPKNFCAKYMHDEDNLLGLEVTSPSGVTWRAYGDKKLLDDADKQNMQQCRLALQASIDEIWDVYQSRKLIEEKDFKAWYHAPTPESISSRKNNHAPLFNEDGWIRKDINDLTKWEYIKPEDNQLWWAQTVYKLSKRSGESNT